jgi:hypothetical protein
LLTIVHGLLKRRALRSKINLAMDSRVGFHEATFAHDCPTRRIIDWCRETLSHTERPHGIDHATLAFVFEGPDGEGSREATFSALRPDDFDDGSVVLSEIESTLAAWRPTARAGSKLRAVLFSWGDLTSDLLKAS